MLHPAEARREAVIVGDDYRRVERLEVKHNDGVLIELGLRLHDERYALRGSHFGALHNTGRHGHQVARLGQSDNKQKASY